jgi:hypothetical protein
VSTHPAPPTFILSRDLRDLGEDRVPRPVGHRIRRGVYVAHADWTPLKYEERHRLMMRAVAATRRSEVVFSHVSAALVWGIPVVGAHLGRVHLAAGDRTGMRSRNGVVWHHDALTDEEVVRIGDFFITGYQRTLLDLARTLPFASAVAALDHGTRPFVSDGRRGLPKAELREALNARGSVRGVRRARVSIDFSDVRAGSVGESVSRANMHVLHFPKPDLQAPFPRGDGGVDISDFDWPQFGRFGEFDGFGKYVREEYTDGRSIEEVVWQEKLREDRIRLHRPFGIRWEWNRAIEPALLRERLIAGGLHPLR